MGSTSPGSRPALGICLEDYDYPYPVSFLPLTSDLQPVTMAYMDIPPSTEPNGRTVLLMHGKAFGGYYFRTVIEATSAVPKMCIRDSPSADRSCRRCRGSPQCPRRRYPPPRHPARRRPAGRGTRPRPPR